jgi:hypothetical protein
VGTVAELHKLYPTIRRICLDWLDRAPSTLRDPMGDLALHLERWINAGCPPDE